MKGLEDASVLLHASLIHFLNHNGLNHMLHGCGKKG